MKGTWLGTLSNLDLKLIGICQELGSHAKTATGDLHAMGSLIRMERKMIAYFS